MEVIELESNGIWIVKARVIESTIDNPYSFPP